MKAVAVTDVSKSYGAGKNKVQALQGINLPVDKGELFGLIGPDGAGKTTLFRILTTLLIPETGTATVNALDVVTQYKQIRKIIGYMPGRFSLYQDLTVEENLSFFATLFNTTLDENYELVKDIYIQIEKFKTRRAGALSGGMKQKLALCCALIHRPSVLVLDEPTTGVDAVSRKEFWELLKRLQQQEITILVSTPYMDEAAMCDRVALIQGGKIMDIDTPGGITKKFANPLWAVRRGTSFELLSKLNEMAGIKSCYPFGQEYHIVFEDERAKSEVEKELKVLGFNDILFEPIQAGIEDCFMALMKSTSDTNEVHQ
ncbi:MAG TPA: ABC transporter ATP-binding protein [Bacteroidia bacterium]|nr:ABC transporter ATP-binding protein [Bacteroidia bacterium]